MEGRDGRRRFVQSTLFPHQCSSGKEDDECGAGERAAEEEELCSSGKKRRRVANSKSKTTPRDSSKNVVVNGKEASTKLVDDIGSSVSDKHNFVVKGSKRELHKRQDSHVIITDPCERINEISSPPSPTANGTSTPQKLKCHAKSTPRKERRNSTPNKKTKNSRKDLFSNELPCEALVGEQPLQTIPDLRLEAKLAAEENLRIFAGRRLHPFFSSRKGGKTNQNLTDLQSKCFSFEKKESDITLKPIHVFENVEDDQTTLDWGHWIFSESSGRDGLECGCSPIFGGSMDSLNFGNFLNVSCFSRASLYEECHQRSMPQRKASKELPHPNSSADVKVTCSEKEDDPNLSEDTTAKLCVSPIEVNGSEGNDLSIEISCGECIDSEPQERLIQERIISHHHASHSQHENCLWTDKYQPQNAKQICGNGESVEFLSDWLHLWHKRGSLANRSCPNDDYSANQDIDLDCHQSDSDYDTVDDEDDLKNVLLITGPVGSGKSAAIYACARDQGFQIIEINASDWRNGALIRQKFGEAVESHWLQRSAENATNSDNIAQLKFKAIIEDTNCSNHEVIELSDKEDSVEVGSWSKLLVSVKNRTPIHQNEIKTLILFEDVDATLYEDHGFIATIQQLAETAKRPMILTSNSQNPVLPKNLDRLELRFSMPSEAELLEVVNMICALEQAKIHPGLVERFVNHCQRDIRKTIILLQFWCQGRALGEDYAGSKFHSTHWQVLFDLDAGHHILPKVIHWDYPSKLSDLVAEEVIKSSNLMEETYNLIDKNNSEPPNDSYYTEMIPTQYSEADPVEVKKKAMLRLHCSRDEVECPQFEPDNDLFDLSCSPVASTQKRAQRKINTVFSSDSEDEFSGCSVPRDSAGLNINVEVVDMTNMLISQQLSTQVHDYSIAPAYHMEAHKSVGHQLFQEREFYSQMEDDTCRSQDASLVPESSFVPETELINEKDLHSVTVSYGNFLDAMGSSLIMEDQDSVAILEPAFDANSNRSLHIQGTVGMNAPTSTGYTCQEEVGDSLSKSVADVPWGYQFLDECSRVDFMKGLKRLDTPDAQGIDFVKEAWRKLYDQCNDMREYVTAEEKTGTKGLELIYGMSNLISVADLLLKHCPNLVSDFSGSTIPNEKIHSCCYYENQLEMSSIIAQHGLCLYVKEIASLGSLMQVTNTLDLASEVLSFSASSVALGKLVSQAQRKVAGSDIKTVKDLNHLTIKSELCASNILQTIVPPRLYLAASKGNALHEYISTLSQISRFECSRLSHCIDSRMQRRARIPRHYLSSGATAMSPEDISLLRQYNNYKKGQVWTFEFRSL